MSQDDAVLVRGSRRREDVDGVACDQGVGQLAGNGDAHSLVVYEGVVDDLGVLDETGAGDSSGSRPIDAVALDHGTLDAGGPADELDHGGR